LGVGYDHPFEGISPGYVPEKDWLSFLKYVKHAPNIDPENGKDYIDAADRWRQDHGYPVPLEDAGYVALVERTLVRCGSNGRSALLNQSIQFVEIDRFY